MEQQYKTKTRAKNRGKRHTGIILAALAALILISGTYAWYYVTNALNEFGGKRDSLYGNSAVLHNDFDEKGTGGVHNKDVYAENTGDDSIFVRIRLDEYMEINQKSLIDGADKMNEATWETHKPGTDLEDCDSEFHDYWEWELGGTTEYVPQAKGTQGVVSRYDEDGEDTLDAGDPGNKFTQNGVATEVIAMAQYAVMEDNDRNDFYGWVYDVDGYAYWSQKLIPGEATGLLLDC